MTEAGQRPFYKWLVVIAVMSGAFLVVLDTTVVNVALPKIMAAFGVNVDKIEWIVTAYMIAHGDHDAVSWLAQRQNRQQNPLHGKPDNFHSSIMP